jgi:Glycosyltransferases involved in cell wall biogenesis
MTASITHLVLIPSYNTGEKVYETIREARKQWNPVWIVVDGSSDGTAEGLLDMAKVDKGLRVQVLPENGGKGGAVYLGLREALARGFTHVLTMDADGQHPADKIPEFMEESQKNPDAMILGCPKFDSSAPLIRVRGRRISNWWANFETLAEVLEIRCLVFVSILPCLFITSWRSSVGCGASISIQRLWYAFAGVGFAQSTVWLR